MADSETQVPGSEKVEERPPRPEYEVIPSKREQPEDKFTAREFHGTGAQPGGQNGLGAGTGAGLPAGGAPNQQAPIQQTKKRALSQTQVYAAIGVGLGLLAGLAVAVIFLHPGSESGPIDLGVLNANAYGLKGHLVATWSDKLEYQLTLEPSDPGQRVAFADAVSNSPRPLSVGLQLKDPFGNVLCSDGILLKFDPRNAGPSTSAAPDAKPRSRKAEKAAEELAARNQIAQGFNLARLESQELNREHGKDVFEDNIGPDGKIASISAQGNLPCTKKQYGDIASWSFTPDFPMVTQQAQGAETSSDPGGEPEAGGGGRGNDANSSKAQAARKPKRESLPKAPPIYIEGDDAIIWYDASAGIVETSAGKALLVDRNNAGISSLKGREFPVHIHYRCDQSGNCTFAGLGLGMQHAKLKR